MAKIAFLGLGAMGFPMAGHLVAKGNHDVTVYNRTPSKSVAWAEKFGGITKASAAEAAEGQDFVFACVGNDDDLRLVTTGSDGAFGSMMAHGTVFVDHTTASAQVARELDREAKDKGIAFVDAPVSGGRRGAESGALTVMCGGDAVSYERIVPIMTSYAKAATLIGPSGSGQLAKMVNQICLVGLIEGLSEGLHFARKAGLDLPAVFEAISRGSAQSWQMENHWKPMCEGQFAFGFAVEWMRKDLSICLEEARRNGASLPGTALIDNFFAEIERMGGARWDTSSLLARLDRQPPFC